MGKPYCGRRQNFYDNFYIYKSFVLFQLRKYMIVVTNFCSISFPAGKNQNIVIEVKCLSDSKLQI